MTQDDVYTLVPADVWNVGRHETACGIRVLTSWLPRACQYETLVVAPAGWTADRLSSLLFVLGGDGRSYLTREAAQDGHAQYVRAIEAWVALQEVA